MFFVTISVLSLPHLVMVFHKKKTRRKTSFSRFAMLTTGIRATGSTAV